MSKYYVYEFGDYFYDKKITPIRDKVDLIKMIIDTVIYIYADVKIRKEDVKGRFIIKVDKMSRIFYQYDNKLVSFSFPFAMVINDGQVTFEERNSRVEVTERVLSRIKGLLETNVFSQESFIDFFDIIDQDEQVNSESDEEANDVWRLLNKLSLYECGYIRYDFDDDKSRVNKDTHPEHHLDINYSNYSTFKFGLSKVMTLNEFINMLDINSNCCYLK